jgi:dihydrolipoamide dehydrogenase
MPEQTYDLIVLGAGPVGENVADYARRAGLSVAVVEEELVGGECSYWACVPSKNLLRPGAALRAAQHVDGAKQAVTGGLDVAAVLARRNSAVGDWDDASQVAWLNSVGIELVRGHGRLAGVKRVVVETGEGAETALTARHAVAVCTGSDAMIPPIEGLAEARPWTSREATSAQEVPESLVVLGGGTVACEMATVYAQLGSTVTVVARGGLLSAEEPFAGELVADSLRAMGVTIHFGSGFTKVERADDGTVTATLTDGTTVTAAEVLVGTGRQPRTADIGAPTVGLQAGDWIEVDDTLLARTATNDEEPWLYAVGDVNHRALLTHQGKYQGRAAGRVIAARAKGEPLDDGPWGLQAATADNGAVPQVTFTDPEVASVGLTERRAGKAGLRIRTAEYDVSSVSGAVIFDDDYTGRAKIVIDEDRDVIVGATFVGPDIAELLQSATTAVVGEIPLKRLWHAVPAYPTVSEVWLRLLETDASR